ncbi:hypothetical protein [Aquabacter sediminis]|nr:hypothetical protein [Aquabacter sp. P-9]MDE1570784.1 hypothetical protein [Aquabacter sp. P-9]
MAVVVRTAELRQRQERPFRDAVVAEMADVRPEGFDAYRDIISSLRRVTA